ncbi:MAG: diguanylate cyclase [Magnetococcales bacterium]|nr:diguanylate cyclase [Magnetococcales bacterium]MBF0582864.1 diguanylate cyclase [Magnetococcales bacterium]
MPKNPVILVVDDDECILAILSRFLKKEGYDIIVAQDGQGAIDLFAQASPDLILLDVSMPFMDGFSACDTIRKLAGGARVPILMMTGLSDDESVDRAFEVGADDYVTKPVHWAVLRQRIRLFMERRKAEATIRYQATFDTLTDLPNRNLFMDRLERALSLARRNQEHLAVLFIDLDRFKEVNDSLGHAAGDALLRQVADRLKECVRRSDTVARMGGDEFTMILSSLSLPMDPEMVARKILSALSRPFDLHGHTATISGSVGIALFPQDSEAMEPLLKQADHAMYMAKRQGKNCYRFYSQITNLPLDDSRPAGTA